jgi:hypothetical protein
VLWKLFLLALCACGSTPPVPAAAPDARLSPGQCDELLDHAIALVKQEDADQGLVMAERKPNHVPICLEQATRKDCDYPRDILWDHK